MAARREVTETQLAEYSHCLLRDPVQFSYLPAADIRACERFVSRVLLDVFMNEQTPDTAGLRLLFETCFRELKTGTRLNSRLVLRASRRVQDLLSQYRVHAPVTPYLLNLGRTAVKGEYAVLAPLKARRNSRELCVLRLRESDETRMPSLVSHARWLHLRNVESNIPDIRILNFSMQAEEMWKEDFVNERQIRGGLTAFVDYVLTSPGHPSPGAHCESCLSRGCMKAVAAA